MSNIKRISAPQANDLLAESGAVVLDIRDERSFAMGRITGARHVTSHNVQGFLDETDKDTKLIVCCYHGNMSLSGASFFAQHGFTEVYSLDGGFSGWSLQFPDQVER